MLLLTHAGVPLKRTTTVSACELWADILVPLDNFYIVEKAVDMAAFTDKELLAAYGRMTNNRSVEESNRERLEELVQAVFDQLPIDSTSIEALEKQVGRKTAWLAHARQRAEEVLVPPARVPPARVQKPAASKPAASKPSTGEGSRPLRGVTARVWALCDQHNGDKKAVLTAASSEGINPSTVSVQFLKWRKANP